MSDFNKYLIQRILNNDNCKDNRLLFQCEIREIITVFFCLNWLKHRIILDNLTVSKAITVFRRGYDGREG